MFPFGLGHSYFLSDLDIRLYRREEVCFAYMAREELWPEYQSVTMTSAIQLGRTLSEGGCMVIQG